MIQRFRMWRLKRAYARVTKLEARLDYPKEAREMRAQFFRDTWQMVDSLHGGSRKELRKARRDLVNGKR